MSTDSPFDPENRELYTALMRPPEGYKFGHAVATTYSMDFETALAIPTAIVFRDAENREEMLRSPLALLQSVERMADRMAIYCERGRIKEARPDAARLMSLYEKTIIEVSAPGGGAFHPKLWCIRFQPERLSDPVRLRLAILSRNLTNDRSWDLVLNLDGLVGEETNPQNQPVVKLLRALPTLANRATRPDPPKFLATVVSDLERCTWEPLPAGATKLGFAVNGLDNGGWVPPKGERVAIISPFVSSEALKRLAQGYDSASQCQLVTRAEEADGINREIRSLFTISTLDERVSEPEADGRQDDASIDLDGLHAKAYLVERGARLQIHVGSANATTAALLPINGGKTQNVEIMASLEGPKTRMRTIDHILGSDSFGQLLVPYSPSEPPKPDPVVAAEKALEKLRSAIAQVPLELHCLQQGDLVELSVAIAPRGKSQPLPDGVQCFFRAITVANERGFGADRLLSGEAASVSLGAVPLCDVTRWLGVRLIHTATKVELAFTLGARLVGVPEGRDAAVLRAHLANTENFLRYLGLLLGSLGEGSFLESDNAGAGQWLRKLGQGTSSLLEPMVRALSLDSGELEEIDRLLDRLQSGNGAGSVVPEDFLDLWKSFGPLVKQKKKRS